MTVGSLGNFGGIDRVYKVDVPFLTNDSNLTPIRRIDRRGDSDAEEGGGYYVERQREERRAGQRREPKAPPKKTRRRSKGHSNLVERSGCTQ